MAPTNKGNNMELHTFMSYGKSEIIGHRVEEKDWRLRLSHERMEMLLCIYITEKNWTTSEREKIINQSVELYMGKPQKTRLAAAGPTNEEEERSRNDSEQIVDSGDDENIVNEVRKKMT